MAKYDPITSPTLAHCEFYSYIDAIRSVYMANGWRKPDLLTGCPSRSGHARLHRDHAAAYPRTLWLR
ncbi:Uncharacterised protein [Salmonella enterica subsp. salamae]|nr:Uncharacterised protein [Salmonella enterica subsp. salamae]